MDNKRLELRLAAALAVVFVLGLALGFAVRPAIWPTPPALACLDGHLRGEELFQPTGVSKIKDSVSQATGRRSFSYMEAYTIILSNPESLADKSANIIMDAFPMGGCVVVDVAVFEVQNTPAGYAGGISHFEALVFDQSWNLVYRQSYRLPER